MNDTGRINAAVPAAPTQGPRSPLVARVGLCAAVVGVALFAASMSALVNVDEEGVWAARAFSVSIPVGAIGGCLSLIGYLQARREGRRKGLALAGTIVGLGFAGLVAGAILLFFIETVLWGA